MASDVDGEFLELADLSYDNAADKRRASDSLRTRGLWERFNARKEELRRAGELPVPACWRQAMAELCHEQASSDVVSADIGEGKFRAKEEGQFERIAELLKASEGRSASPDREVRWVTENIPRKWSNIDPDDVPSEWCVGTLAYAKRNEHEFRMSYDVRIAVARAGREVGSRGFRDDGRTLELLTEQIRDLTKDRDEDGSFGGAR